MRRTSRLKLLAIATWSLVLVLWSAPLLARAQEPDQAGRVLREAATLRDAGDVEGARARLEDARARWPGDARVTFALGSLCVSALELEAGWALLREASRGSDPLVREAAEEQLARLTPQVAVVIVDVQAAPTGSRLSVAGASHALDREGDVELALPPGEHEVVVRDASGVPLARARVHAARGSVEGIALRAPGPSLSPALTRDVDASAPPTRAAAIRMSDDDVWIAVGVASASVAVTAVVTTVIALAVSGGQGGEPMGTLPGIVLRGRM